MAGALFYALLLLCFVVMVSMISAPSVAHAGIFDDNISADKNLQETIANWINNSSTTNNVTNNNTFSTTYKSWYYDNTKNTYNYTENNDYNGKMARLSGLDLVEEK